MKPSELVQDFWMAYKDESYDKPGEERIKDKIIALLEAVEESEPLWDAETIGNGAFKILDAAFALKELK